MATNKKSTVFYYEALSCWLVEPPYLKDTDVAKEKIYAKPNQLFINIV